MINQISHSCYHIKPIILLLLGFVTCLQSKVYAQDCAVTSEITIVGEGSSNVILNVEGLLNDDLVSNQSLCGVRLVFEHDQIENIRMVLVSPFGQRITLVGPGRLTSGPSFAIDWNVAFVPCSVPPSPDAGIAGTWDNGEPWASFNTYSGVYHPFDNCLEDFNEGSANGAWSLEIENLGDVVGSIQYFELIFCDPTGSACSECFLFAGNFNFSTPGGIYTFCETDPLANLMDFHLDQDSILTSSQDYSFIYSKNDSIIKRSDSPNEISDLIPGTYTLCGLAFQNNVSDTIDNQILYSQLDSLIEDRSICADLTEDCITLRVLEIENKVTIDTTFCEGDSIAFFGNVFFDDIDTMVIVSDLINDSCDSLIFLSAKMKTVNAVIDNSSDISQCGSSVFLNGSNSNTNLDQIDNYQWSTADGNFAIDIGPIAELTSGGTYYLNSFSGFCFDTDSIIIQQIDTFDWSLDIVVPDCFLDSFIVNVSSVVSDVDFDFNTPDIIENIDNQVYYTFNEGLYNVEANLGTCDDSLQFILNHQATELSFSVSSTMITCLNDSSEIVISTNAINAEFELNGPENIVSFNDTIFATQAGNYNLLVTDELGCQVDQDIIVDQERDDPVFDLQDLNRLCNEVTPNLAAVITSPFDSLLWTGPNGFESNQIDVAPGESGTYSLTVFGENGCDLTKSLEYLIENVPFALPISYQDLDCENTSSEVCYSNPNINDVIWTFNNIMLSNDDCFIATEEGQYFIEVVDANGCKAFDSTYINDLRIPLDIDVVFDSQFLNLTCAQEDIVLEALINGDQENIKFQWFDGTIEVSDSSNITINEPSEISLVVTDTLTKCTYSEVFTINELVNPFENFEADIIQPLCKEDFGAILVNSPLSISQFDVFLNGNMILEASDLEMLTPGNYTFEIVDENSCVMDTTFTIEEGRELILELGDDIQTAFGTQVSIDAEVNIAENEIAVYDWSNSDSLSCSICLSPSFTAFKNEEIVLNINDLFGCEATDTLRVIIDNEIKYFVPNVFSPNDDGDNDNLTIYLSGAILKVFDLRVMDRWGNLVLFRPEILNENDILVWDGFFEGKPVVQGVYVYVAKLLLIDGTETLITGDITVIR